MSLFNCNLSFFHNLWKSEVEVPAEQIVYQLDQLEVKVELNPIGGYRGKVGSVTIHHVDKKGFNDWNDDDLQALANLERKILLIQEQAQISNTLIIGRQEGLEDFKLSFVAYPKCNWIEKIQGFLHVIFGTSILKESEVEEIAQYYRSRFAEEFEFDEDVMEKGEGKPDAFCRPAVIEAQNIHEFSIDDETYNLLHDKWPKGAAAQDPHFLIVPKDESGHCDGSHVSQEKRFHMLKIARKLMQILLQENKFSTFLFIERNGKELQGVQHKHAHVIGIEHFPTSFLDKIKTLFRQVFAPVLSNLADRIHHYQQQDWTLTTI